MGIGVDGLIFFRLEISNVLLSQECLICFIFKIYVKISFEVAYMNFMLKKTKDKQPAIYKTLYIQQQLCDKIDMIASKNQTSWNNVVISMIESCLKENEQG